MKFFTVMNGTVFYNGGIEQNMFVTCFLDHRKLKNYIFSLEAVNKINAS
jgi:hypothetical protein